MKREITSWKTIGAEYLLIRWRDAKTGEEWEELYRKAQLNNAR